MTPHQGYARDLGPRARRLVQQVTNELSLKNIETMTKRIQAVITAKGGETKR